MHTSMSATSWRSVSRPQDRCHHTAWLAVGQPQHWSAILWQQGRNLYRAFYDITTIVDRVGGGDSVCAGLIYGLRTCDAQQALNFARLPRGLKPHHPRRHESGHSGRVEKLMEGRYFRPRQR